jgi:pyrimidine-nucleoside phosphorylase
MKTLDDALSLGEIMAGIGKGVGRRVTVVISDMNQPLGSAVGNALEVREAIETLQGEGPDDFVEHCLMIAAHMLVLGHKAPDPDAARRVLAEAIESGAAFAKFRDWIQAQGGDIGVVDDPGLLPRAPRVEVYPAPRSAYLSSFDAMEVGLTAVQLGAGREKKGDPIDHSVGIEVHRKVGDYVSEGQPLFTVHARDEQSLNAAAARLLSSCSWSEDTVEPLPLFYKVMQG